MELADRVVVMNRGRIEQIGSTDELYEHPSSPFVFDFLGDTNVLPAEVRGRSLFLPGSEQPFAMDGIHPNGPVGVYVRPGDLRLAEPGGPGVEVRVATVQRTGPIVRASAETLEAGVPLAIELPHLHHDVSCFAAGSVLRLRLMQYSIYPRPEADRPAQLATLQAPVLVGRERERGLA